MWHTYFREVREVNVTGGLRNDSEGYEAYHLQENPGNIRGFFVCRQEQRLSENLNLRVSKKRLVRWAHFRHKYKLFIIA